MASSDSELINEVRAYTDYDSTVISDSDMQELVNIGKDELRSHLGDQNLTFYTTDTFDATRALFWMVIIGGKVKTGELASVNLTVGSLRATSYSENTFGHLFRSFDNRLRAAEQKLSSGVSMIDVDRDERNYGQ